MYFSERCNWMHTCRFALGAHWCLAVVVSTDLFKISFSVRPFCICCCYPMGTPLLLDGDSSSNVYNWAGFIMSAHCWLANLQNQFLYKLCCCHPVVTPLLQWSVFNIYLHKTRSFKPCPVWRVWRAFISHAWEYQGGCWLHNSCRPHQRDECPLGRIDHSNSSVCNVRCMEGGHYRQSYDTFFCYNISSHFLHWPNS